MMWRSTSTLPRQQNRADSVVDDAVAWALAYPFRLPMQSYVVDNDGSRPLDFAPDLTGRHGVLASGSNQSPDQLQKKFAGCGLGPVFVLEAWIDGWDAVYSAHFSSYGSVPATLVPVLGVRSRFFVTWLTDTQLARMHETEALGQNYTYGRIDAATLRHQGGADVAGVYAYFSRWGPLRHEGAPVSLAAIPAQGRPHAAMSQTDIQRLVRNRLAPTATLSDFVAENIRDEAVRRERTRLIGTQDSPLPPGVCFVADRI